MVQEPRGIIEWTSERIAVLQPLDVAHHLRLRVVAVEDGVGEESLLRAWGAG
jgi:hypothetical protein